MTPSDPYKILGVDKKASQDEVKKAPPRKRGISRGQSKPQGLTC